MKRRYSSILIALVALTVFGCAPIDRKTKTAGREWYKETKTFDEAVAAINRNNQLLPTLWARHNFEAVVVDDKKKSHEIVGDGALLYSRPRGMLMRGNRPLAPPLFEVGSVDDRYWLTIEPEVETMWWGNYANLGKPCVDASLMPIRPDLMIEILGLGLIETDFLQPPVPTMRFNHDQGAYMFTWNARLANRFWAQREIWYDVETLLPTKVILYDENGRVLLRANLSAHKPVKIADLPEAQWPKVATKFQLFFPSNGTRMSFELEDVVLDKNGIPSKRGITFPQQPGVRNVIQIDKGCNDR